MAPNLKFAGPLEAIEGFIENGWTDGLPIVPPTPDLGEFPPKRVTVTAENVATNAVMAGCLPEYMPVVVAAVRAALDPDANLESNTLSLAGSVPALIVNGPVRSAIGVNSRWGLFGPGFRANATIGRALRLIVSNVCQLDTALYGHAPFSQPGRYTWCFGENEEESPWSPLHVERGLTPEVSAVTFYPFNAAIAVLDDSSRTPERLLKHAAFVLRASGWTLFDGAKRPGISSMLVLGPEHVRVLKGADWTKPQVQEYLWDSLTAPAQGWELPAKLAAPDRVLVVVAGGEGLPQSWWLTPHTSSPVTRPIEKVIIP